jgi:hypothetical protein
LKFIPDANMALNEQLNAIFRFSVYFSIVVAVIKQDGRVLFFGVFVGLFTFLLTFYEDKKNGVREGLLNNLDIRYDRKQRACSMPTKENPFMNVLISDYDEFPNKPKACNIVNKEVKKSIKEYSNDDVYRDIDDVFNRNTGDRQFYTSPVTTIPNAQGDFAHWVYNTGSKERGTDLSIFE